MSNRSKLIAKQFAAYKRRAAIQNQNVGKVRELLDEGFRRTRNELVAALKALCEELNAEPELGNILVHREQDEDFTVSRTDTGDTLKVKFDEFLHKISLNCDVNQKFREVIEVKPQANQLVWWVSDKEGNSFTDIVWFAEKSIKALIGIPS